MTISGTNPFDNEEAQISYGAMVVLAEQRVDEWFAKFHDTPLKEPGVIGYVIALRGIARMNPSRARAGRLHPNKVDRWKEAFQSWIDEFGTQVKVKRGVNRDEMWEHALQEFDALKAALNDL